MLARAPRNDSPPFACVRVEATGGSRRVFNRSTHHQSLRLRLLARVWVEPDNEGFAVAWETEGVVLIFVHHESEGGEGRIELGHSEVLEAREVA